MLINALETFLRMTQTTSLLPQFEYCRRICNSCVNSFRCYSRIVHNVYSAHVPKNKADYVLAQRHQTATKRSNFWHSDLRDNYDCVFHLSCVMPIPGKTFQTSYILAINKIVKQLNSNFKNSQHYLSTLNHENTTKCAQNVHREP